MKVQKQKEVLAEVKAFIVKYFDEEMVEDMQFLTGEEGMRYSEYAHKGNPYVSFDGGIYDYLNYGSDGWKFQEAFINFLESKGLWYEQGNAWNLSIYDN